MQGFFCYVNRGGDAEYNVSQILNLKSHEGGISMKEEIRSRSIDVASQAMLVEAEKAGLEVAWDRYQA